MAKTEARQVLSGTNAKVFLAGEEVGFWTSFSAAVTINYEDVYVGSDVDRKEISRQGNGSISKQETNSVNVRLLNKLKTQKDLRFEIETEIINDATGEVQSMTIPGVTLDSIPIATWEKGAVATSEISFRFPPSRTQFPSLIS